MPLDERGFLYTGTVIQANAETAQHQGAMIALKPRRDYANLLAVPGGEPPQELHCTLVFFGETIAPERFPTEELANGCDQLASIYGAIPARVFGQAIFNPNTTEPAATYLVNDVNNSAKLAQIQRDAMDLSESLYNVPDQFTPFHAHITASYDNNPGIVGRFTGDIVFDRLVLDVAGREISFPLT